jgi:hypothetical protein
MKNLTSILLLGLAASIFACERIDVPPTSSAQSPVVLASANLTLADLALTMDNAADIDFFRTTPITDHSERGDTEFAAKLATGDTYAAKPKIKFLWHGTDPNSSGCKKPKGLCLIINLLTAGGSPDFVAVEAKADRGLLYLYFPGGGTSDHGVTADGYLPVGVDLPIPDDVLTDLGITHRRTAIKAGIYKASYDAKEGRFHGIALELVEL